MMIRVRNVATGTVRRGFFASSEKIAALSNPTKAGHGEDQRRTDARGEQPARVQREKSTVPPAGFDRLKKS